MSPVSEFADLLTPLSASASKYTPGDFGQPGTYQEIVPAFTCYGRKLKSSEKQVAGVDASVISYAVYADLPLHPELTEKREDLKLTSEGVGLGTYNVRSIVPYPSDGFALLEVDKLNTA